MWLYYQLRFALLISLSTEQLPVAYFSLVFLLQAELLLIFTQRKHIVGSHTALMYGRQGFRSNHS